MHRKRNATNFVVNFVGMILPLLVMVVTIPIYVEAVGDARYGVVSIMWLLLGYVGFLDLGLTRASANALARATDGAQGERATILVTAAVLSLGFGLVGALILFVAGDYLFERVLTVPEALRGEMEAIVPWLAALFPLALVLGVFGGALESRERFLTANLLSGVGAVVVQIVPVVCALMISPSLTIVVPAAVLARMASSALWIVVVYRLERPMGLSHYDLATARRLLGYGGWVTISSIVSPLLTSMDQFVIGSRIGLGAVTYYAIPMNLVTRGQIVAVALSRTLFPSFSRLDAAEALELGARATAALALGLAALCAPGIIVVRSVLTFWIGPDFAEVASPIAEVLLIGTWINGVAFVPFNLLQAQGRPDLPAKFHAAEILPYAAVLWLATTQLGLLGAAFAWTLRVTVDAVLMIVAARFSRAAGMQLLPPAFCVVAAYAYTVLARPDAGLAWIVATGAGLCIMAAGVASNASLRQAARDVRLRLSTLMPTRAG